ncbi:MAG TPA: hypothetical protein VGA92_09055 [Candidatus Nitrosotenuis sp.]
MEYSLEFFATIGHVMTGIGTMMLSVLLYKTFRHMEASTRATELQTEYKFRPWVGPIGTVREINDDSDKKRFEITIRNYGEYAATDVTAASLVKSEKITRDDLKSKPNGHVSLGPLLPNMEKRFWFDIDNQTIKKTKETNTKIFVGITIEYPLVVGNSEYGMISEVDPETLSFVHKDMWVQSPPLRSK